VNKSLKKKKKKVNRVYCNSVCLILGMVEEGGGGKQKGTERSGSIAERTNRCFVKGEALGKNQNKLQGAEGGVLKRGVHWSRVQG